MPTIRRAALPAPALALALAFAACSAGAASPGGAATPGPSAPAGATVGPSLPAGSMVPGAVGSDGATGTGVGGDPGTGTGIGGPVDPTPVDPGAGQPPLLVAKPGQLNPRPVSPQELQASVDGRHVLVKVTWTSGVEPCYVLDSVKVERSGMMIALTVLEGSADANAMCIEIAMVKATIVDLGDLEPGTWSITAPNSEAAPISLTIS